MTADPQGADPEQPAPAPPLRAFLWPGGSGPRVAALFHRLLAVIFLIAWLSLAVQVRLLVGERGLMPLARFLEAASAEGPIPWLGYPSILRFAVTARDGVLLGGTLLGALLALVAMAGLRPRLFLGLGTALYLSYVVACRTFLSFQWDNLLLECGTLALFLPSNRPAPVAHLAFRLLLFKLYFESGIAKWQSPLHDWQDGSAMTYYYETAPLPAALAFYAHHLPVWWHHFESRATLALELVIPFAIFAPRPGRLAALGALTAFQIVNAATANYGFFCYLAVVLHLFLLDERDLRWLPPWLAPPAGAPAGDPPLGPRLPLRLRRWLGLGALGLWGATTLLEGAVHFTEGGPWLEALLPVRRLVEPLRLVNSYHLFASITRERIEPQPEIQRVAGGDWVELDLRHKPGDPGRRPDYVAPHQPRVDFQLWFHGLSFQARQPLYVASLLRHLCEDRGAVQPLFRRPVPEAAAVRMAYYQYHFTTRQERRATGRWWSRTLLGTTTPIPCDR
jgi:hypothetical protein